MIFDPSQNEFAYKHVGKQPSDFDGSSFILSFIICSPAVIPATSPCSSNS